LEEKLRKLKYSGSKDEQEGNTTLHYKELQTMYLSYDTATLTSNISNIDIEEIIDCFSIEIEKRIVHMPAKQPLNPLNP
jgi:hypothetical protein